MQFIAAAETDIGNVKTTNQDSALILQADSPMGQVLMAVLCDGMGGLSKGELASAAVIRRFEAWFDQELACELVNPDLQVIGGQWALLLKELNAQLLDYGLQHDCSLGTTFTGMLFVGDQYMITHVGDTRAYAIDTELELLTEDQTYVHREILRGNMTPQQARTDPKRNMLLQCVGASKGVEPALYYGKTRPGVYMLCSDGFRHEITPQEIYDGLNPARLPDKAAMHQNARQLIELVKSRRERDNITVILIRAEEVRHD